MPNLQFLTHTMASYDQQKPGWHREERRLYGHDAVLEELLQWKGETDDDLAARKQTAGYITLPKLHASTLIGHLSGQTPMPEFGKLGKVPERRGGIPTLAELLWFNVDGVGQDGTEMMPWVDGVNERALATGYRWVMVEMPSLATLRNIREAAGRSPDGPVTMQDVLEGFRPYPVEYGPQAVPFYQMTNGRLDFAVVKILLTPTSWVDDGGSVTGTSSGFYLLVRRGFRGLGDTYAEGGWWKFDENQEPIEDGHGTWDQTLGQIPLFQFLGEPSTGTTERPAIARSLTMELGQIAVSLMVLRSARDYNIVQAAKSVLHVLGINPPEHEKVLVQSNAGSLMVGYPPVLDPVGGVAIPQIWCSSAALLDSQAFESVIKSGLEEAREIMVKQVTSGLDASGEKVKASFAEGTSPLLARLAATRQQAINTFLYFASLRFGIQQPNASVQIPREFDLAPVIDNIDAALARLKRSWLRSQTWEKHLLIRAGDEEGTLPEDKAERKKIEDELTESGKLVTEAVDLTLDDDPNAPSRQTKPPEASGPQGVAA
jgi:hypothetical protein